MTTMEMTTMEITPMKMVPHLGQVQGSGKESI